MAACPARLPVSVTTTTLAPAAQLAKHLLLVYTGLTRLAKNLLERVLRFVAPGMHRMPSSW